MGKERISNAGRPHTKPHPRAPARIRNPSPGGRPMVMIAAPRRSQKQPIDGISAFLGTTVLAPKFATESDNYCRHPGGWQSRAFQESGDPLRLMTQLERRAQAQNHATGPPWKNLQPPHH